MDKNGNAYDVFVHTGSGDAGRIAGGSMSWSCRIAKANGTNDASFSGYSAVFSRPSSKTAYDIINDIKGGMYLEDYIAKHWADLDYKNRDLFKSLLDSGDAAAKTFDAQKQDINSIKKENFYLTYILLPKNIRFSISESGIGLINILQNDRDLKKRHTDVINRTDKESICCIYETKC